MTTLLPIIDVSTLCSSCETTYEPYVFMVYLHPEYRAEALCAECFGAMLRLALGTGYSHPDASKSR